MIVKDEDKILRIGTIYHGKVVSEKIIRKPAKVTIGSTDKNRICISSPHLPKTFTIFDGRGDQYVLCFTDQMKGRISIADSIADLTTLKAKGIAKKSGDIYYLPLLKSSKGKIAVGDATVLFQFIDKSILQSKVNYFYYPSKKQNLIRAVNWNLIFIFMISVILHSGSLSFSMTQESPKQGKDGMAQLPDRWVKVFIRKEGVKIKPKAVAEVKKRDQKDPAEKAKDDGTKVATPKSPGQKDKWKAMTKLQKGINRAQQMAHDRAHIIKVLSNESAILKYFDSKNGDNSGSMVTSTQDDKEILSLKGAFGRGGSRGSNMGDGGSQYAMTQKTYGDGSQDGGTTGKTRNIKMADIKKVDHLKTEQKQEIKVKPNISLNQLSTDGEGSLDKAGIANKVMGYLGAFKACYLRELIKDQNLQGKITVRFSINQMGRVSGANVIGNTMGNQNVATCILERLQYIRFGKPEGGSISVTFPFVFNASK